MPGQSHLMMKVDTKELIQNPEIVLHKMSIKIQEKRCALIQNLVNSSVQFQTKDGIKQGICEKIDENICYVNMGGKKSCVDIRQVIF